MNIQHLLLVTVTLSMMTTPLLMKLVDKWLSRQFNGPEEEDEKPWVNDDKPQVIVVGFGRFGQVIGRLLMANKMRITVLVHQPVPLQRTNPSFFRSDQRLHL